MKKIISAMLITTAVFFTQPTHAQITLTTLNTLNVRGNVSQDSMAKAKAKLFELNLLRGNSTYPIYIVLNTPGGDVMAGEDFIQFARSFQNIETITIFAASMGAGIAEGVQGKRHILPNGTLMFHRATVGLQGQVSEGEFESRLAYIKTVILHMESRNATRMNLSLQDYKAKVKDELWYYGPQALINAAADDLVSVTCTPQLVKKKTKGTLNLGFFEIDVQLSECPTIN